jgi:nucleotide-binding universal stress UspA family protein
MFDKALVALDLSPAEQPIVDCLPALRQWGVRHLILTHVIRFGYTQGAALAHQQDYVDWLQRCAHTLREEGLSVEVQVRSSGVPADEILTGANETNADLIIIGSRGQNILSKLFLGSVARDVIHKSTRPLLLEWVEPTAQRTRSRCEAVCTDTLHHIVFATDFSPRALAAERAVVTLAPRAQATECVHVLPSSSETESSTSGMDAQRKIEELVTRLHSAGAKASAAVLQGVPSAEIARHAASRDASLIIVGKHGQNWLESTVIGSTAERVCEIAGRPVLMVP